MPAPDRPSAARRRIMDTATGLFYAHGVRAVGVDRIIAESTVAKATFYKHFPSKDDLVVAYLDEVDTAWQERFRSAAEAAGPDPAAQLVGIFDALRVACRDARYRGCAFLNVAIETEAGTPIHERAMAHKRVVQEWVLDLAERTGAHDPAALAHGVILLLDGALASGAMGQGPEVPLMAQEAARALVATATRTATVA